MQSSMSLDQELMKRCRIHRFLDQLLDELIVPVSSRDKTQQTLYLALCQREILRHRIVDLFQFYRIDFKLYESRTLNHFHRS